MHDKNDEHQPIQIQLELPDYSYEYEQYLNKVKEDKKEETVIIIDIH